MTATSPEQSRAFLAAHPAAYQPFALESERPADRGRRDVGWVLVAAAVGVLALALASPMAATAESSNAMLTALFVLAIALVAVATAVLLPARSAQRSPRGRSRF